MIYKIQDGAEAQKASFSGDFWASFIQYTSEMKER
jgi:hypothetical protein